MVTVSYRVIGAELPRFAHVHLCFGFHLVLYAHVSRSKVLIRVDQEWLTRFGEDALKKSQEEADVWVRRLMMSVSTLAQTII